MYFDLLVKMSSVQKINITIKSDNFGISLHKITVYHLIIYIRYSKNAQNCIFIIHYFCCLILELLLLETHKNLW